MYSFRSLRRVFAAGLISLAVGVPSSALAADAAATAGAGAGLVDVGIGESVIQRDNRAIARVLISDPSVAELRLLEEGQYQVRGLAVGSTDLWVWYRDNVSQPVTYKVVVSADLTDVGRRIRGAVNGPAPKVYPVKDRLVVEGPVEDLETLERVAAIAKIYDEDFVNLMTVRGDHQVQLRVVFAEVNRTSLRELGLSVLFSDTGGSGVTAQLPGFTPGTDVIQLIGAYTGAFDISGILAVLEQNKLSRTLAEPSLVALSGQQAEFLAGGEIPVPVDERDGRVSIEFKEYGVKLVFVPTVLSGNVIDMRAFVEVSELDPNTTVRLSNVEVPGMLIRKGDSHLRLESGMTFAMAGMLHERTTSTRAGLPVLGDLPIVGALFRYVKHKREETELVIFVTPELVRPMAPDEVPPAPGKTEGYNPSDFQLYLMGQLAVPGSRTEEPTGEYGMKR